MSGDRSGLPPEQDPPESADEVADMDASTDAEATAEAAPASTAAAAAPDDDLERRAKAHVAVKVPSGEEICEELLAMGMSGDKYLIEDQIAQGGMGAIYRAVDQGLKRCTVLKVILPDVLQKPDLLARFVEEARITGQLEHPNIIPVHDLGALSTDKLYFSMKYIQGEELGWVLKRLRIPDPKYVAKYSLFDLLTIFRKVCDAVAFAHSRDIIHRDIKPDNIMVGPYGEVLLVDWGLARREDQQEEVGDVSSRDDDLERIQMDFNASTTIPTQHGVIKGTPAYMSPEQARGEIDRVDRRTDIFLLGATLYSVATLYPPYTGVDIYEMVTKAEEGSFVPPMERAPTREISVELSQIILRAMAPDPDDRYQTVQEMAQELDALLAGRLSSQQRRFAAGQVLMREGDVGEEAFVVASGRLEVWKLIGNHRVTLQILGPGAVVGEMALLTNATRSATVTALEDAVCFVINASLMERGLDKLPNWMNSVLRTLVERLRLANENVHPLMTADCSYHILNQLRLLYLQWGRPVRVEPEGKLAIGLNTGQTIFEISTILCLPQERVTMVLAALLEWGLLRPVGEYDFVISNSELFAFFTDYVRRQLGVESPLQDDRDVMAYVGHKGELMVQAFSGANRGSEEAELDEAYVAEPTVALGCVATSDIPDRFAVIFKALHELPIRPAPVPAAEAAPAGAAAPESARAETNDEGAKPEAAPANDKAEESGGSGQPAAAPKSE